MRGQVGEWLYIACGVELAGSGQTRHGRGAGDGRGRTRGQTGGERGRTGVGRRSLYEI